MAATTLDTVQLARLIDLTPTRVRQLTAEGVLSRARNEVGEELRGRYEMIQSNHAYIHYLRKASLIDDTSENRFVMLRNSRMASESEIAAMRVKQLKGELLPRGTVEFWATNMLTAFKTRIQGIPSRITHTLVAQCKGEISFQSIFVTISTETDLALSELSTFKVGLLLAQNEAFLTEQGAGLEQLNGDKAQSHEDTGNQDDVAGGFFADEAAEG